MNSRPHTGRRRNDAARQAVLDAAVRLTRAGGARTPLTLPAIAAEAGVGRQTIYRWWPSPGAVLTEALADAARRRVPEPDTGSLAEDLREFLGDTFEEVGRPGTAEVLTGVARQAAHDEDAAALVRSFTATRRDALRAIVTRHPAAEIDPADLDLLLDQVYGTLWYRLLLGHAAVDRAAGVRLARTVEEALRRRRPDGRPGRAPSPGCAG